MKEVEPLENEENTKETGENLQERLDTESLNELEPPKLRFVGSEQAQAELMLNLANAQTEFKAIHRDTTGQAGNQYFKYAPLATILATIRPALAAHGIALLQPLYGDKKVGYTVTTILAGHGARIEVDLAVPPPQKEYDNDRLARILQNWGAAITYVRRYGVNALNCLDADSDVDEPGDQHQERQQAPAPKQQRKTRQSKPKSQKTSGPPASSHKDEVPYVDPPDDVGHPDGKGDADPPLEEQPEPDGSFVPETEVEIDDEEVCTPEEGQEVKTLMKRTGVKANQIGKRAMEITGCSSPQELVVGDMLKKKHYRTIKQTLLLELTEPQE